MRRPLQLIGEAYLLGSAALAFLLLAFSVAGIRWSRPVVIIAAIVILVAAIVIIRRQRPFAWPTLGWANLIDLLTLALIAGYVRVTTLAPPAEADFYAIWGAKAKQFFMTGGIDWRYLTDPLNFPSHVDYPILQPLLYDAQALFLGRWPDERWLGLVHIAASGAALLVIRGYLADEMPKLARAAATLILMPLVFSPFFGLPEGLLAVYGTLALLFLRRAIRDGHGGLAMRGAVYLGLAASCKNEGLSLMVAVVIAMLLDPASIPDAALAGSGHRASVAASAMALRTAQRPRADRCIRPDDGSPRRSRPDAARVGRSAARKRAVLDRRPARVRDRDAPAGA